MMIDRKVGAQAALGSVDELNRSDYTAFMERVNEFASLHGMRTYLDWSKVWEYPWLWFHGLRDLAWWNLTLLDLGSELSPMPWLLASLGARVHLIEASGQFVPTWTKWRREMGVDVGWSIVDSEHLPVSSAWADVVTSFSVIEHQADKATALREVVRVLKPGGAFAVSFDICEPASGMTFPSWNGAALTVAEFERLVWSIPEFDNQTPPVWNRDDIEPFLQWHRRSAPHHNYVVGAAFLRKVAPDYEFEPIERTSRVSSRVFWCHYNDPENVGDHACCPIDYADLPGTRLDLRLPVADASGTALIFGGGGILHQGTIQQIGALGANARRRNPRAALVAWGIGANELNQKSLSYPEYLREFDLVGIRDVGNPWTYVPCPSCLHPIFGQPRVERQHEFVIYEHAHVPIGGLPDAPRMTNRGDRRKLVEIVNFLGQGDVVITNSFHGVYWALLLGRKVIVFRPFANRFLGFARPVEFCDESDWREKMRRAVVYDDYFDESRSINRRFREEVRERITDALINARMPAAGYTPGHSVETAESGDAQVDAVSEDHRDLKARLESSEARLRDAVEEIQGKTERCQDALAEIGHLSGQLRELRSRQEELELERAALRLTIEHSLALRLARSLHWVLGPALKVLRRTDRSPTVTR